MKLEVSYAMKFQSSKDVMREEKYDKKKLR